MSIRDEVIGVQQAALEMVMAERIGDPWLAIEIWLSDVPPEWQYLLVAQYFNLRAVLEVHGPWALERAGLVLARKQVGLS